MGYDGPNYTQTPNLFLDEHLPEMGCAETKVVLAVIRQTFGWHKQKDQLSISQLMELTGLSNRAVIDGTRAAMERGVIDREQNGDSYQYWLVVDGEDTSQAGVNNAHRGCEDTSQAGVNNAHRGCEDTSQAGVNNAHTQKKQKETNSKETKSSAPAREGSGSDSLHSTEDVFEALVDVWRSVSSAPPLSRKREDALWGWAEDRSVTDPDLFRNVLQEQAADTAGRDVGMSMGILLKEYKKRRDNGKLRPDRQDDPDWTIDEQGRKCYMGVPIEEIGPQNLAEDLPKKDGAQTGEPEVSARA